MTFRRRGAARCVRLRARARAIIAPAITPARAAIPRATCARTSGWNGRADGQSETVSRLEELEPTKAPRAKGDERGKDGGKVVEDR